jgi:hypothetical protein
MVAILTGMRWNLNVVLICISFMARDVEHFLCDFLAIWIVRGRQGGGREIMSDNER